MFSRSVKARMFDSGRHLRGSLRHNLSASRAFSSAEASKNNHNRTARIRAQSGLHRRGARVTNKSVDKAKGGRARLNSSVDPLRTVCCVKLLDAQAEHLHSISTFHPNTPPELSLLQRFVVGRRVPRYWLAAALCALLRLPRGTPLLSIGNPDAATAAGTRHAKSDPFC